METAETGRGAPAGSQGSTRPYKPSWVDLLCAWVGRRPGPNWPYYGGLAVLILLSQAFFLWAEGGLPISNLSLNHVYLAAATAYMLALIHYLDERAGRALETMRPALQANDREYQRMLYRLTTLPPWPTVLASLAALLFVFVTEAISEPYRLQPMITFVLSTYALRTVYLISWMVLGAFLYHTLHQLQAINHIYTGHTRIDLFRVKPLYAFSNLAALTAGSLAMVSYGWLLVNPWIDRSDPLVLTPMLALLLFAAVAFVWPQVGIHRLLVAEKERLLDEANHRFTAAVNDLHGKMDRGELEGMVDLNMALASLQIELKALEAAPTWPWEREVLQLLVTSLALPLGLWLIQLILQRTLDS